MTALERIKHRRRVRRIRNIKRICILTVITLFLVITLTLTINSFSSMAKDNDSLTTYKYFTSVVVEHGDTLYSFAEEYGKDFSVDIDEYIEEVIHINHLEDEMSIRTGQNLIIPYYSNELIGI